MNMVIEPYILPVRDHQTKLQQMLHTSKQAEDLWPKSVIPLFHLFAKHPSSKFKIITSELVLYLHCFLNKIVKFFVGEFRQRLFIVIQRTTNIHIGHRHLNFPFRCYDETLPWQTYSPCNRGWVCTWAWDRDGTFLNVWRPSLRFSRSW